ncbi:hypothetical protein BGY98DRAFT_1038996 [Russula aff. rugulosa BPL654]|nr:hypothetical protein BGY98DRAFT_1038996 [Russula aff. rugulosa BPL654]
MTRRRFGRRRNIGLSDCHVRSGSRVTLFGGRPILFSLACDDELNRWQKYSCVVVFGTRR